MIEDKIVDMQKITLNEGDVLVVRVDTKDIHISRVKDYLDSIRETLSLYFLSNKILVMPSTATISVIGQPNAIDKE